MVLLYYFTHDSEPDWSFYTSDKTILKDPALRETHELSQHVKKIKVKNNKSKAYIISVTMIVLLLLFGLYLLKTPIVNAIVNSFPVEWEIKLGDVVYKQYSITTAMVETEESKKILNELTKPLLDSIKDKRFPFKFSGLLQKAMR